MAGAGSSAPARLRHDEHEVASVGQCVNLEREHGGAPPASPSAPSASGATTKRKRSRTTVPRRSSMSGVRVPTTPRRRGGRVPLERASAELHLEPLELSAPVAEAGHAAGHVHREAHSRQGGGQLGDHERSELHRPGQLQSDARRARWQGATRPPRPEGETGCAARDERRGAEGPRWLGVDEARHASSAVRRTYADRLEIVPRAPKGGDFARHNPGREPYSPPHRRADVGPVRPRSRHLDRMPTVPPSSGEPHARGSVIHGFRAALVDLWGDDALATLAGKLPLETRVSTVDALVLPFEWVPLRHVVAWHDALWAGPCAGDEQALARLVGRSNRSRLRPLQERLLHDRHPRAPRHPGSRAVAVAAYPRRALGRRGWRHRHGHAQGSSLRR